MNDPIVCVVGSLVVGAPYWIVPAIAATSILTALVAWSYARTRANGIIRLFAATLKVVAIFALAACLLEPLFSGTRPRSGANAIAVMVDNSESMNVRPDLARELTTALHAESEWQTRLAQDFDLRNYTFDQQLRNVENFNGLMFNGTGSSLKSAISTVVERLRKRPTAGVILFSDGNGTDWKSDNDSGDTATSLGGLDLTIPIFPVVQISDREETDLRVTNLNVSQTNFEAAPTTIEATVAAEGCDAVAIVGRLVGRNEKGESQVVQSETQTLDDGEAEARFRFRFRPETAGLNFYKFETFFEADESNFETGESTAELTVRNNVRWVVVDRGGGPYRILYVAGRPNWEFKFLRRALDADEEIKLASLLRIARKEPKFAFRDQGGLVDKNRLFEGFENEDEEDVESYAQPVLVRLGIEDEDELRDGFPKSAEELFDYDAIIIDDVEAPFFTPDQMTLLRRFVSERGGGLMMLGGQESFAEGDYDRTPVGEMLPVYTNKDSDSDESPEGDTLRWSLTREGMLQPWARTRSTEPAERAVVDAMPTFRALNRVADIKPGAQTVAKIGGDADNDMPALVTQRFGKGRTAALLVGDMWRWSMRREQSEQDDLSQLWRQMTRWLVADVPRHVDVGLSPYTPGTPITIDVTVRNDEYQNLDNASVALSIIMPDESELMIDAEAAEQSGVYSATYWPKNDGCYKVTATATAEDGSVIGIREAGWAAEPTASEFESLLPNRKRLDRLAQESGGEVIEIKSLDEFVKSLPNRKIPVTEPWVYPLWHHPFVFGLAILCLCGEWGLRRWKGLP